MGAIAAAEEPPEEVLAVTEPAGAGPAEARNAGAARADSDLLVFVDADVVVHADAFSRIRKHFESDPELTAVFGAYDQAPEDPSAVSGFRNLLHHHVHRESAGPAKSFWTGLGAIRRDAFASVGGFDRARFPRAAIEDVELGARLSAAGHRIWLDPEIQGTHLKSWTIGDMVRTDFAGRGLPWTRLLLEGRFRGLSLNLAPRGQAGAVASVAVVIGALLRRPRLALAGIVSLLALNRGLYALIWRRRGPVQAGAAVGLHLVHNLTAVAAAAAGVIAHLWSRATSA